MKNKETTQTEEGHGSAQGESPKDEGETTQAVEKQQPDETSDEQKSTLRECEKRAAEIIQKEICAFSPLVQKHALELALANVSEITTAADKLLDIKERLYQIYDNLDVKTRYVVAVLLQVQSVEGICSGVSFGGDILYSVQDSGFITYARQQLSSDRDMEFLNGVYELAKFINDSC